MTVVFPWLTHDPAGLQSFVKNADAMTHISPTWMAMDAEGRITLKEQQPEVAELARAHGLKLCPLIVNEGFRPDVADAILRDPVRRRANADRLCDLVEQHGWNGLNLDFEGPFLWNRDHYTDFVARIAERLRPRGIELSVDVVGQTKAPHPIPAKGEPADHATWQDAFDYKALGALVDHFMIMGYDFHGRLTPPGPVGPTWWLREVLAWTIAAMPAEKAVLGLPFYGRQWTVKGMEVLGTKSVLYPQAKELLSAGGGGPMYDWDAQSWQYRYADEAGQEQILWFDDAYSLAARMELVKEFGIAGVAFWCLGQEDARVWDSIRRLNGRV